MDIDKTSPHSRRDPMRAAGIPEKLVEQRFPLEEAGVPKALQKAYGEDEYKKLLKSYNTIVAHIRTALGHANKAHDATYFKSSLGKMLKGFERELRDRGLKSSGMSALIKAKSAGQAFHEALVGLENALSRDINTQN